MTGAYGCAVLLLYASSQNSPQTFPSPLSCLVQEVEEIVRLGGTSKARGCRGSCNKIALNITYNIAGKSTTETPSISNGW